ncbi:MAG: hypothetical protein MHM6MM_002188 [Cercozoa sp. M6MM]
MPSGGLRAQARSQTVLTGTPGLVHNHTHDIEIHVQLNEQLGHQSERLSDYLSDENDSKRATRQRPARSHFYAAVRECCMRCASCALVCNSHSLVSNDATFAHFALCVHSLRKESELGALRYRSATSDNDDDNDRDEVDELLLMQIDCPRHPDDVVLADESDSFFRDASPVTRACITSFDQLVASRNTLRRLVKTADAFARVHHAFVNKVQHGVLFFMQSVERDLDATAAALTQLSHACVRHNRLLQKALQDIVQARTYVDTVTHFERSMLGHVLSEVIHNVQKPLLGEPVEGVVTTPTSFHAGLVPPPPPRIPQSSSSDSTFAPPPVVHAYANLGPNAMTDTSIQELNAPTQSETTRNATPLFPHIVRLNPYDRVHNRHMF